MNNEGVAGQANEYTNVYCYENAKEQIPSSDNELSSN